MKLLLYGYLLSVVVYLTWGMIEGRGLPGWAAHQMMEHVGWSDSEIITGLLAIILLLPALPFLRKEADSPLSKPVKAILSTLLILTPALAGYFGQEILKKGDERRQAFVLETVDLARPEAARLSPAEHLLRVSGAYYLPAAILYTEESYGEAHTLYVPLVDKDAPTEPFRFVMAVKTREDIPAFLPSGGGQPYVRLTEELPETVEVTVDALATPKTLPVFITQKWKDNGFETAEQTFLLEGKSLVDDKLPSQISHLKPHLAFYLGLGMSLMLGLGLGLGLVMKKVRG